jgi:transposase
VLPGQDLAASIVTELASNIRAVDERLKTLNAQIAETFNQHPHAAGIQSMPSLGPVLGSALLVAAT